MARWVYGIHPVEALLSNEAEHPEQLLMKDGERGPALRRVAQLARARQVKVRLVSGEELARLTQGGHHQGVAARVGDFRYLALEEWLRQAPTPRPSLLVLDGIQDPHNLGAILRTADAFAVGAIILPKDHSCGITEAVTRAAAGAAESASVIQVTNLARCLDTLKDAGYWIIGTAGDAELSLYEADLKGASAFVFGNEGQGMRRLVREHCDLLISLPCLGQVSSLNVSVSVGVVLGESLRQQTLARRA